MVELCSNFKTLEFKKKKSFFLAKTFFFSFFVAFLHYVFKILVVGCCGGKSSNLYIGP